MFSCGADAGGMEEWEGHRMQEVGACCAEQSCSIGGCSGLLIVELNWSGY